MPLLFDTYDPRPSPCRVYLTEERYQHICTRHPELTDHVDLIQQAVERPWFITADEHDDLVENYYSKGVYPGLANLWLRVVVKQGKILTAYLVGNLKKE